MALSHPIGIRVLTLYLVLCDHLESSGAMRLNKGFASASSSVKS